MTTETPRYEPTPRKLADIRSRGEVPRSRELSSVSVLLIGLLFLWYALERLIGTLKENFTLVFTAIRNASGSSVEVARLCVVRSAFCIVPFIVLVFVVGFCTSFLQDRPLFSLRTVFSRSSASHPLSRLSRLFSGWHVLDLFVALVKLSVVACIVWVTLEDGVRGVLDSMRSGLQSSMINIGKLAVVLWFRIIIVLLIFAIGDFFYQRYRFRQHRKMTRDELLREQREIYGDPLVRQRRSRIYRAVHAHTDLEETARATIVVYGGTQIAVALHYKRDAQPGRAPEILAKGRNVLAQRMLYTAARYTVPTALDFRLAMSLYKLEIGKEVPPDLYPEVAARLKSVGAA